VGQKVVCVDASEWESMRTIKHNGIYTIASVTRHHNMDAVHLAEVPSVLGFPYYAYRFRPVVERKTDISIFTAMLNPSKRRVSA
jgi:hypothetical protein